MVMLNSTLPEDIRVLSWAPVGPDFSARFNCLHRTYKYFFPKGTMDLDVSVGKHLCTVCVCVCVHVHACVCVCSLVGGHPLVWILILCLFNFNLSVVK